MSAPRVSLAVRFASMVSQGAPDECWMWTGPIRKGYGAISAGGGRGRTLRSNRVAWELQAGEPVPTGLIVRHRCDEPLCCNPAHLELGTHADNSADRVSRGRHVRGAAHPRARLNDESVRAIRGLLGIGLRQRDIASAFGVAQAVISGIQTGRRWAHVEGTLPASDALAGMGARWLGAPIDGVVSESQLAAMNAVRWPETKGSN